jgi:hypothetical protein
MSVRFNARRVVVGFVAAAAMVAMIASLGGQASAGPPCPEKTLCLFEHNGFTGQVVKIRKDGVSNKLAEKMNNQASSAVNNLRTRAFLYEKRNGKGDKICLQHKDYWESLGTTFDFNDVASSSRNTKNRDDCPVL